VSAPAVGSRWIDRDGAEWLVARVDGDAVRLQRETVGGLRTHECDAATLRRRFAHVETWFVLTDRETGRRITGVPGDA